MQDKKDKQIIELGKKEQELIYYIEIEVDRAQRKLNKLLGYSLKAHTLSNDILKESAEIVRLTHKLMIKRKGISK